MKRSFLFILLSLCLHLNLILFLFIKTPKSNIGRTVVVHRKLPVTLMKKRRTSIERRITKSSKKKISFPPQESKKGKTSLFKSKKMKKVKKFNLSKLGVRVAYPTPNTEERGKSNDQFMQYQTGIVSSESGEITSNSDGTERTFGDSIINCLYNEIDQYLNYPGILTKEGMSGRVRVKLAFDRKGSYLESDSQFQAMNSFLKVHVAQVLRKSLKHKTCFKNHLSFRTLDVLFDFDISIRKKERHLYKHDGASLYFYRFHYGAKKKLEEVYYWLGEGLVTASNFLNLIKYRPDFLKSDKERLRQLYLKRQLQRFKEDQAWDY